MKTKLKSLKLKCIFLLECLRRPSKQDPLPSMPELPGTGEVKQIGYSCTCWSCRCQVSRTLTPCLSSGRLEKSSRRDRAELAGADSVELPGPLPPRHAVPTEESWFMLLATPTFLRSSPFQWSCFPPAAKGKAALSAFCISLCRDLSISCVCPASP